MPKRISQLATEPCSECGGFDFANRYTCRQCAYNVRCHQIRESQRRRRSKTDQKRQLRAYLVDRRADLRRRYRGGNVWPVLFVWLTSDKPVFTVFGVGPRRGAGTRRGGWRQIEITKEAAESFLPGLHVFGADFDPPVAISLDGSIPPCPPKADLKTLLALVPMPGFDVFPVAQRCTDNHNGLFLEYGLALLRLDGQPFSRRSALCVRTFCEEGPHHTIDTTQTNEIVNYQHRIELRRFNDPEVQEALDLPGDSYVFPDRVIPTQNQCVGYKKELGYIYFHYWPVEDGSLAQLSAAPMPISTTRLAVDMNGDPSEFRAFCHAVTMVRAGGGDAGDTKSEAKGRQQKEVMSR